MPVELNTGTWIEAIHRGERSALASALNLLDDRRAESRARASKLLAALWSVRKDNRHLIGITGPPGAGKSSLTAALVQVWRQRRQRVGILAVDPSSPLSGGALLGDRLRMVASAEDDGVFVRSLACRGEFGGLSAEAWPMAQVMMACFDITVIETVGVGQREIDVSDLCDTTCYVAQPGSGDSIQFLKAGILEVPQILVVNKSDMGAIASRTLSELSGALAAEQRFDGWNAMVLLASATHGSGIAELTDAMAAHHQHLVDSGQLQRHRKNYPAQWIEKRLRDEFGSHGLQVLGREHSLMKELQSNHNSPFELYDVLRLRLLSHWKHPQ